MPHICFDELRLLVAAALRLDVGVDVWNYRPSLSWLFRCTSA